MADISKIGLALFLLGFWLFLPIPMQLFNITGYSVLDDMEASEPDPDAGFLSQAGEFLSNTASMLGFYFKLLFFEIPGINPYLKYFVRFLQFATGVFIILMLRGN